LDKPSAAAALVQRVFTLVEQLGEHPERGSMPAELGKKSRYRQLVEPPCRVFYRFDGERVFILHVMRSSDFSGKTSLHRAREKSDLVPGFRVAPIGRRAHSAKPKNACC